MKKPISTKNENGTPKSKSSKKETLEIHSFLNFKKQKITLNNFNVFIGEQASGKTSLATLFYFFKDIPMELCNGQAYWGSLDKIIAQLEKKFSYIFPPGAMGDEPLHVTFHQGDETFEIKSNPKNTVKISIPPNLESNWNNLNSLAKSTGEALKVEGLGNQFDEKRHFWISSMQFLEKNYLKDYYPVQLFIPSNRNLLIDYNFSDNLAFQEENPMIDHFRRLYEGSIKKFSNWSQYSKSFSKIEEEIIKAEIELNDRNEVVVKHQDGRSVGLAFSSSGQQSLVPIFLILRSMEPTDINYKTTLFIDEPELHLFPQGQRNFMKLLVQLKNIREKGLQTFITTHSPFILAELNNLLQRGFNEKNGISPESTFAINSDEIGAYVLENGQAKNILRKDTGLIEPKLIEKVSSNLMKEFGDLLEKSGNN